MAIKLGQKALAQLGCPVGGDEELACLRAANATVLQELAEHVNYSPLPSQILAMMMPWTPVIDGDELPYRPQDAITTGNINKVPVFYGTVANESVEFIYDITTKPIDMIEYDLLLDLLFGSDDAKKIKKFYGPLPAKYWSDAHDWISVMATDYIFYCVNRKMGTYMTKVTDTFMYLFDQVGSWNEWVFGGLMPWCVNTVCHAADIPFVFNPFKSPTIPGNISDVPMPTERELDLIHFMQTAWGNFARTGNPNIGTPLPNATGVSFPIFNGTKNILVNESIPVGILDGYRNDVCDFWDTIGYIRY